jgi:hypothetical protein
VHGTETYIVQLRKFAGPDQNVAKEESGQQAEEMRMTNKGRSGKRRLQKKPHGAISPKNSSAKGRKTFEKYKMEEAKVPKNGPRRGQNRPNEQSTRMKWRNPKN